MIRAWLLALSLLVSPMLLASQAWAIGDPSEALPDPAQEARAVQIGRQLRCLVCQNESIEESGADLARDLRKIVRTHVAAGESEAQITAWLVARYGNFVRLRPPVNAGTLLLWASPLVFLLIGGATVFAMRRGPTSAPAPLSLDEKKRLQRLMDS
jgi:cytochrome c-type biogenesis protein CcmH